MRILADENIPLVQKVFSPYGRVQTIPGRAIDPDSVKNHDILLVRSITPITQDLIQNSRLLMIGTATAGKDHVDEAFLKAENIPFFSAPGSNARSVAEYVFSAILEWAVLTERPDLHGLRTGIIGVGEVGSRVARIARLCGMIPLLNDPPRQARGDQEEWTSLSSALEAEVVTFHPCLERHGPFPSLDLLNPENTACLCPNGLLINASRGPVIRDRTILELMDSEYKGHICLDVFEREPEPDRTILRKAWIRTPHIAGYSLDGKLRGTFMLHDAFLKTTGLSSLISPEKLISPPENEVIKIECRHKTPVECACEAARLTYGIVKDHKDMDLVLNSSDTKKVFDNLRKNYRTRREFPAYKLILEHAPAEAVRICKALGFGQN